ncbi:neuroglian-like isoform X2 [Mercenaria mercenaria]|uniref:neuroglian-like isoform X2 n=1 Tax=Mercenaria mercenaria TaxID=6596 RepID=UPI00234E6A33|nr:neuroglian-like isoform X2 [Mercenaria mercenaria]
MCRRWQPETKLKRHKNQIRCEYSRYIWKRNGEVFNPSGQDDRVVQLPGQGTLVFNNPEPKDEGIFQCFADNGYGVSASIKVNLKEAILKKFVYVPKTTHRVKAGKALTLPCTPPQSNPPADVYWVYRSRDGRWEAVNFNKRVTMDFEGRLRFTNTKKEDEAGGRTYCCMASNYLMRDNAIGPEHEVKIIGGTEHKRPAHELWTSPSDQFFLKGQTLRLKCIFAGSPTPEVYWERLDAPLPGRAKIKSFGQELRIYDVELSDAGQYQCMGLNTQSSQRATKAFNVRIESAPYWTEEPVDVEAGVSETATFICRAGGIPKPDYTWFINGVPLEDGQGKIGVRDPRIYNNLRFFKPNQNNITLINLTRDDHMNIQCNSSNKHGYVFSDVYLNVLAEKPIIVKLPPAQKKVTEGQSVILECLVTGKPDPIVTWYRGTSRITGGRFQILSNGNLHIAKVVMADAGDYRCQAYNIYGNATSSACKTQIRSKTRITQYPMDLEVIAGFDAKFTCAGSTDFDEANNMQIYWEKDDKRLFDNKQRVSQNFHDNSLTISGTVIRDSGVYTCVVTNGLDEDRAYTILTVKGRPDPPSSVEIERCRDDSATVKWIKGIENNAPVQYFIIQYNTSFYPDQWVSAKSVDYTQSIARIDLQPWANYTFRVIATNKIGTGQPSQHTQRVCRTNPDRPNRNPRNLRSIGDKRNTLKLQWTPVNEIEHNGPGFKYQLTIRGKGSSKYDTYSISNWKDCKIEIQINNTTYTPYFVRLHARNSVGVAKEDTVDQILYSFEDIPKVHPYDVAVVYAGDTYANITWSWDSKWLEEDGKRRDIRGDMKGFKVQYWQTDKKLSSFYETEVLIADIMLANNSPKDQKILSENVLYKLSPYSSMQVQIRVINNYYAGPPSEPVSFKTLEGVPGPVQWLAVGKRSSNSVTFTWMKPSEEECNGILIGYDIGYQTVDGLNLGAFQDNILQIDDPNAEFALLGGLLPAKKYRVHVFARTSRGRGEGTFIEVSTTLKPSLAPPVVGTSDITKSSINVSWEDEVTVREQEVHYVEFRKKGASAWQKSLDAVQRNYMVLTDLESGTDYEIRVVVFDGLHRKYSELKVIATAGLAYPRSIAANYVWLIVMLCSGMIVIAVTMTIFIIYRRRRNVKDTPRYKRGIVIMDSIYKRRFVDNPGEDDPADKLLVKGHPKNKHDAKRGHMQVVRGKLFYRGRAYERVKDDDKFVRCVDNTSVSDYQDENNSERRSLYGSVSDYEVDTYSDDYYNSYDTEKDSYCKKYDQSDYDSQEYDRYSVNDRYNYEHNDTRRRKESTDQNEESDQDSCKDEGEEIERPEAENFDFDSTDNGQQTNTGSYGSYDDEDDNDDDEEEEYDDSYTDYDDENSSSDTDSDRSFIKVRNKISLMDEENNTGNSDMDDDDEDSENGEDSQSLYEDDVEQDKHLLSENNTRSVLTTRRPESHLEGGCNGNHRHQEHLLKKYSYNSKPS